MIRHLIRRLPPSSFAPRARPGMALLELLCAAAILSSTMVVLVPMLSRINQVRSDLRAREAAVRELGNIVERVRAGGSRTQRAFETIGKRIVEERLRPALDDVQFTARLKSEAAGPESRDRQQPIVMTITWTGEQGTAQSIALVVWASADEAASAGEAP